MFWPFTIHRVGWIWKIQSNNTGQKYILKTTKPFLCQFVQQSVRPPVYIYVWPFFIICLTSTPPKKHFFYWRIWFLIVRSKCTKFTTLLSKMMPVWLRLFSWQCTLTRVTLRRTPPPWTSREHSPAPPTSASRSRRSSATQTTCKYRLSVIVSLSLFLKEGLYFSIAFTKKI